MAIRTLRALAPLALAFLLAGTGSAAAQTSTPAPAGTTSGARSWLLPVNDFARHATLFSPRLSPDGKHLLVRMDSPDGKDHSLVVYDLSTMQITSQLRMPVNQLPLNPQWVSNDWIVLSIGEALGTLDAPGNTGQVIATQVDGKRQRYLFGWHNGGSDARAARRGNDEAVGEIVGVPDVPNEHVYVRAMPFDRDNVSILYDIDVPANTRRQVAEMDVHGMSFLVGPNGNALYAFGDNKEFKYVVYQQQGGRWVQLTPEQIGAFFTPLGLTPDHKRVYALIDKHGGPTSLIEENLDGSQRQVLASNDFAGVGGDVQWTADPKRPFAVIPAAGVPQPIFFNANAPDAKLYRALQNVFPGEAIDFINFSQDGTELLLGVSSDRDPGAYYLFDTRTHKLRKLFSVAPWINPKQMGTRFPFRFKARDGMMLEGILTFPPHRKQANLPMVLVPHGGPYFVRDDWYYDEDAQFLANRGYLVLQVNYRGSSGRGIAFEHAGYKQWGTGIQQDLIDGVKWAIANHLADPNRICVYGGSFGGYSAMMTVIRAPHLFKCAIGYAGVYDLQMLFKKGDIQGTESGDSYLRTVLGTDPAVLAANSPDKLADKIDVPVLLVHGKGDQRAPFAGAEAMRDALEAAHKPFEWMAVAHEGHGFYTAEDRAAFLTKMQAFLAKYIGPGTPPNAPNQ